MVLFEILTDWIVKTWLLSFFQVFPEQQMKKKNLQTLIFLTIRRDHIQHSISNTPRNPSRDCLNWPSTTRCCTQILSKEKSSSAFRGDRNTTVISNAPSDWATLKSCPLTGNTLWIWSTMWNRSMMVSMMRWISRKPDWFSRVVSYPRTLGGLLLLPFNCLCVCGFFEFFFLVTMQDQRYVELSFANRP